MKIGIPKDYFGEGLDEEVKEAVLAAAKTLEEKGAIVEEFDLGLVEYAIPAYYVIAAAEASSNLSRFDGMSNTDTEPKTTKDFTTCTRRLVPKDLEPK